jgi:hypothetical protein
MRKCIGCCELNLVNPNARRNNKKKWNYSQSSEAQNFRMYYKVSNVFAAADVIQIQVDPKYVVGKCNWYKLQHSIQFAVIFTIVIRKNWSAQKKVKIQFIDLNEFFSIISTLQEKKC